jgi:hypothetical protein
VPEEQQPPRDPSSTFEILRGLADQGYTEDMVPREGGLVLCRHCGQERPAGEFGHGALRRMEGASDPGDMSAVIGLTCPSCSSKGVLVLMYGPEASGADSDVLAALDGPDQVDPTPH